MADKFTPEQEAAEATLRQAVTGYMNAFDLHGDGDAMLVDYLILTAYSGWTGEGEQFNRYYWCTPNGMDWHRVFGLVDIVRHKIRVQYDNANRE